MDYRKCQSCDNETDRMMHVWLYDNWYWLCEDCRRKMQMLVDEGLL